MTALPPVLPDMDWHKDLRLPADHWIRHQTNDYSVHPKAVGRRVHVKVDDDRVVVTLGKEVVASHERVLASHVPSPTRSMTGPGKRPERSRRHPRPPVKMSRSAAWPSMTASPLRHDELARSRYLCRS